MPWPKGRPHTPEMIAKRIESFISSGAKRKVPQVVGGNIRWLCPACGRWLDANGFYKSKTNKNGLSSDCRSCHGQISVRTRDKERTRDRNRIHEQRRRAWKAGSTGEVTRKDVAELLAILGSVCLACGWNETLTLDHIVPLSRGGLHHPTNLQPLCRKCNERKQARTADYRTNAQKQAVFDRWERIEFRKEAAP